MANEELDQLKAEATDLGIEFSANIGAVKLQDKVDAYYKAQESSGDEITAAIAKVEKSEEKPAVAGNSKKSVEQQMAEIALMLYTEAKKTKIVTIVDNDQRVNNQTTLCTANWSNAFYDMGTQMFPLNVPIEIAQGFIDVLNEVQIPHHVKDNKTGLSTTVMRKRFSINVEVMK